MEIGLSRIAWTGPGQPGDWPWKISPPYFRPGFVWLPLIVLTGLAGWTLSRDGDPAASEPVHVATAVIGPAPSIPPGSGPAAARAQSGDQARGDSLCRRAEDFIAALAARGTGFQRPGDLHPA